jgi:hypothetical protein
VSKSIDCQLLQLCGTVACDQQQVCPPCCFCSHLTYPGACGARHWRVGNPAMYVCDQASMHAVKAQLQLAVCGVDCIKIMSLASGHWSVDKVITTLEKLPQQHTSVTLLSRLQVSQCYPARLGRALRCSKRLLDSGRATATCCRPSQRLNVIIPSPATSPSVVHPPVSRSDDPRATLRHSHATKSPFSQCVLYRLQSCLAHPCSVPDVQCLFLCR